MTTAVLHRLLAADLDFDPVSEAGLTNHLPMLLIALERLGADDQHLHERFDRYRSRLVDRRESRQPIDVAALDQSLGTGKRYADLFAVFRDEIDHHAVPATLGRHLPRLLDGLGGAAFHGLIRLAYALDNGRPVDVAAGLAYLADVMQPVPAGPRLADGRSCDPVELLNELAAHPHLSRWTFEASGFQSRFAEVAADPDLGAILGRIAPTDLSSVADAGHTLFRSTGDFFALHVMTATHATRIVVGHLSAPEDRQRAIQSLVRSIATAYVVIGTPGLADPPSDTSPSDWREIAAAAIRSDDEHVVKLAYTCREQAAANPSDPRYARTATFIVGLSDQL